MNLNFADTLYFKKENTLEIILGFHRTYKFLQREIQTCCEVNNLTFNELIVLLEVKKGFKKKIDIANKIFIKKQNLNLILKDLERKNILKLDLKEIIITNKGITNANSLVLPYGILLNVGKYLINLSINHIDKNRTPN